MKVVRVFLVAMGICAVLAGGAFATEGGGGAYPNGAEGLMTGAVPPPGDYLINYLLYYSADEFMGPTGKAAPVPFDLTVWANVLRYIHVTDKKVAGGFWTQHIFIPIMQMDVDVGGISDDKFGLGDVIVDPFVVAWHGENWHAAAGVDIYVPIGSYDAMDLANLGRNYWTIEPVVAATYLFPGDVEASVKIMYDINMENDDTDVKSGDEFHFDYAVAKKVTKELCVGVSGFYYDQVSEDEVGGAKLTGSKGKQIAYGPVVSYQKGKQTFVLKWQIETETENKPEGDRIWFKFISPL